MDNRMVRDDKMKDRMARRQEHHREKMARRQQHHDKMKQNNGSSSKPTGTSAE